MMSSVDASSPRQGAPRVGADLRAARERLAIDLPSVCAALRIRLPHLEAIEDGRIGDLPGNAYALGFVRTYAAALGLDADEVARRFRAEAAQVNQKTKLAFPVPVPERGIPAGAVVLLGVALAVGAYVGWYRLSGEGVLPPEVVPPVPERLAPLAQQVVPSTLAQNAAPAPNAGQPVLLPSSAPVVMPAPMSVPANAAAAAMLPPWQPSPVTAPVVVPPPDEPRMVVRARGDSWIQVRDKQGQVLFNRVLHAGESWSVPPKPPLLLTTGNAGGTELLVDGVISPSVGGAGVVRRDVPLDPDLLKAGKLPVQQVVMAGPPKQYGPPAPAIAAPAPATSRPAAAAGPAAPAGGSAGATGGGIPD